MRQALKRVAMVAAVVLGSACAARPPPQAQSASAGTAATSDGAQSAMPDSAQVPSPAQLPKVPEPPDSGTWSLLQREQWATLSTDFTRNFLDDLNSSCGTRIEAAFVFESFRGHFSDSREYPLGAGVSPARDHAMAPFIAIREICDRGGDMAKSTVRSKIHRVEVRWVDGGNSAFTFANGTVSATINPADGISEVTYKDFIVLELKKRL